MTDREMLELAARAAGYVVESHHISGGAWVRPVGEMPDADGDYPGLFLWRPREDDGDALRLAVQCGIEISIVDDEPGTDGRFSRACAGYATEDDPRVRYVFEDHKGDLFAATRRAIVRAAAEIGRQMEVTK